MTPEGDRASKISRSSSERTFVFPTTRARATPHPQVAYATGGSLKPTHAVTMHAILVLPALARLLSFANWTERRRLAVVLATAAGSVVLAAVVAVENIASRCGSQSGIYAPYQAALAALDETLPDLQDSVSIVCS